MKRKMASYLHHTATTKYPCCVPALGDSEGASCVGLAEAKLQSIFSIPNENFLKFYVTNRLLESLISDFIQNKTQIN